MVVARTLLLWLHSVFMYFFFSRPDPAVQPSQGSRIFIFFTDLVQDLRLFIYQKFIVLYILNL
jgi:hypothetical protein